MRSRALVVGSVSALVLALFASACGDDTPSASPAPDSEAGTGDGATPPDGPVDLPDGAATDAGGFAFVPHGINHILSTGQSLSVGARGAPALSTSQPFANVMFDTGVMTGDAGGTSFVPLVEGDLIPGTNQSVETMSSGMANLARTFFAHDLLVSVHGWGGIAYVGLKKGTTNYANGVAQVNAAKSIATAAGKSYGVSVVTTVHGESDHLSGNQAYAANLAEWQADYDADVRAITGQKAPIPMLETQISSWTRLGSATSTIPAQQLDAHVKNPGKVVLVGAKYHLPYDADGLHLSNEGYRHMGEDYAKVYRRVVLEGRTWEPLRPKTITRASNAITVVMHVPVPPLVLDTTLVSDPGNKGFELADTGGAKITGVAVAGPDTVTVSLSGAPGPSARLRYAFTGNMNADAGPQTGPRGNLRDSDATPSRHGYALHNWCVHFDEAVP